MKYFTIGVSAALGLMTTGVALADITLNVPVSLNALPLRGPHGAPLTFALTCNETYAGAHLQNSIIKKLPVVGLAYHDTIEMIFPNVGFGQQSTDTVAEAYDCSVAAYELGKDVTGIMLKGNPVVKGHLK